LLVQYPLVSQGVEIFRVIGRLPAPWSPGARFPAGMNSLTYLSRQFDVLASARTPPSTPTTTDFVSTSETSEKVSHNYGDDKLMRTQTWSKPLTQPQAEERRPTKRSFSLPAFASSSSTTKKKKSPHAPYSQNVPSSPVERKRSKVHQLVRRLYFIRAFVVLWNAVCEAWKCVVRRGITRNRTHSIVIGIGMDGDGEDATSADERDSEEEFEPLVTRALPQPASDSVHHTSSIPFPESSPPSLSEQSPSVSTQIPAPQYLSLKVPFSSSPIESSSLLPNPFATSLLTQTSSQNLARSPSPISLPSTPPPHPRKTPFHLPKTLVLDLDETLIHSTSRPIQGHGTGGTGLLGLGGRRNKGAGHMVEVVLGGRSTLYHVYKRPFVDYFLRKVG
jgi:CTD nuclear envelope phosphatase 1